MRRTILGLIGFCLLVATAGFLLLAQPYLSYRNYLNSSEGMEESGASVIGLKSYFVKEDDPTDVFYQRLRRFTFEGFSFGVPPEYQKTRSSAGTGVRLFENASGNRIVLFLGGVTAIEDRLKTLGLPVEFELDDVRNDLLEVLEVNEELFRYVVLYGLKANPSKGIVAVRIGNWKGLRFDRSWVVYELWKGTTYNGAVAFSKEGERLKEEEEARVVASLRLGH